MTSPFTRLPVGHIQRRTVLVGAAAIAAPLVVRAQSFPSKPVRLVVPYPAGSPLDVVARKLTEKAAPLLGQSFIVDNRPGGNGMIGCGEVVSAPPDGETLVFTSSDSLMNIYGAVKKVPYDSQRDFAYISQVFAYGVVLAVRAEHPANNFRELLAWIKSKNGSASYSSWGAGSYAHLIGQAIAGRAGAPMIHTPYKGTSPGLQDLIAGVLDIHFMTPSPVLLEQVQKGRLKLLAASGEKRSEAVPNLPTFAEQGMTDPIVRMLVWCGMAAPARTPPDIVAQLNRTFVTVVKTPEFATFLKTFSALPVGNSPQEFAANVRKELPITVGLIKAAGVMPE